jgi:hypothetical protein
MWARRAREVLDITDRRVYPNARAAAKAIGCVPALVCMALAGKVARAKGHRVAWFDECPNAHAEAPAVRQERRSLPPLPVGRGMMAF